MEIKPAAHEGLGIFIRKIPPAGAKRKRETDYICALLKDATAADLAQKEQVMLDLPVIGRAMEPPDAR